MTSTVEDGKLKIKTVSETPEIRNLSDQSLNHHEELRNNASGTVSGSESDDGSESKNSVDRTNDVVTTQSSKDTKQQQEQSNSKQLSNNCTLCQAHLLCRFLKSSSRSSSVIFIFPLFQCMLRYTYCRL